MANSVKMFDKEKERQNFKGQKSSIFNASDSMGCSTTKGTAIGRIRRDMAIFMKIQGEMSIGV